MLVCLLALSQAEGSQVTLGTGVSCPAISLPSPPGGAQPPACTVLTPSASHAPLPILTHLCDKRAVIS